MIRFIKVAINSIFTFFRTQEVPLRDRLLVLIILLSIVSPLDLIPDTIPGIGVMDDLFFVSVLYDFAFKVLERQLALRIYQGSERSFGRIEKILSWLGWFRPTWVFRRFWKTKISVPPTRHNQLP